MARNLSKRGCVSSREVEEAFSRIDRSLFLPKTSSEFAWEDAPLRAYDHDAECVVHLSAPSIYAAALEALDLSASLSFLNVGSGAGYFSALASTILGPGSIHHCVEISAPLVDRCRQTFRDLSRQDVPELRHANVHVASCFDLDLDFGMKFDRIYVGAGAKLSDAKALSKLLKPKGIIVGPFEQDSAENSFAFGLQALLKATKVLPSDSPDDQDDDEPTFEIEELMDVQFAPLSRKSRGKDGQLRNADFSAAKKNDDQKQVLTLRGPTWGKDSPELFAPCFLDAIHTFKKLSVCGRRSNVAVVPWHVWQHKIWPLLAHDDIVNVVESCSTHHKHLLATSDSKSNGLQQPSECRVASRRARRSLAIAKAVARWTLNRLTVSQSPPPENAVPLSPGTPTLTL